VDGDSGADHEDQSVGLSTRLKSVTHEIKRELAVYRLVLADSRTPRPAKILLGLAVGYLLMPFDLIPDFIPVIGQLDDLLIVPGLVLLALRMIPKEVVAESRAKVQMDK
jgi:uncharacterized membrane protein YkvA (DUF1232 family)